MACRNCGCPACTPDATPKGDGGSGSTVSCKDDSGTTAEATQAGLPGDRSDTPKSAAPVPRVCAHGARRRVFRCLDCGEIDPQTNSSSSEWEAYSLGRYDEAAAPVHVSLTPERISLLEHHCSEADFATIGKLRDESYAAGYQAGRDDAARLNVKQVSHVVELGSETLRTLVAALLTPTVERSANKWPEPRAVESADSLLAKLEETKP